MAEITEALLHALEEAAALRAKGDMQAAQQKVQDILTQAPTWPVAYNYQGGLYHALGDYAAAIQSYTQAIQLQPDYLDAYYNLGLAYLKTHDRVAAVRAFDAILSLNEKHPGARFQQGRLAMEASDYVSALGIFQGLVQDYPHHAESNANLAACYLRAGRLEEAMAAYDAALVLDPKDTQAWFNVGVIHSKTGRDDLAKTAYLNVLSLNPRHTDAHVNVAALYWKARMQAEALLHYREARRLRPDDALIEHALKVVSGDASVVEASPEYTRTLFNAYADTYDQHLMEALHYRVPQVFDRLLTRFPWRHAVYPAVLDLGCGTGLCAPVLRPRAQQLVGVDLAPDMLSKAKEKGAYDALVEGEALWYLTHHTAAFDLVVAADVFVYIGDLEKLLAAAVAALTPQGRLLFNVEVKAPLETGFALQASGRFWHDPAYLAEQLHRLGLMMLSQQTAVLRYEAGKPVMGLVCLWEKYAKFDNNNG